MWIVDTGNNNYKMVVCLDCLVIISNSQHVDAACIYLYIFYDGAWLCMCLYIYLSTHWSCSHKCPVGCCTNGGIGPTWDNPKLRRIYWLLNRLTAIRTNPTMDFRPITGRNCGDEIDECRSAPCLNDGVCSEPLSNSYRCSCPPGVAGLNCERVYSATFGGDNYIRLSLGEGRPARSVVNEDLLTLSLNLSTTVGTGVIFFTSQVCVFTIQDTIVLTCLHFLSWGIDCC